MLNNHSYCIIMAGGFGSRFWPISRADKPKQFLDFTSEGKSFLLLTYDRMKDIVPDDNILVVSLSRFEDLVKEQLPELKEENLLLEPYNRNTAPCLAYANYTILKRDPLAVTLVMPSDQIIGDHEEFNRILANAFSYAAGTNALITIGVVPTRPDTNFGYIQMMDTDVSKDHPVKVKTFTEKPDVELAKVFIETGEFLWNTGIFIWKAAEIKNELEKHMPEITQLWTGWQEKLGTDEERSFLERIYTDMPRASIDYALMEKTENAWVYPAKFSWADIGNWDSLYDYLATHDANDNAISLKNKCLIQECKRNIIYSDKPNKLFAMRGLEDCIVIDTKDVLMICPRDVSKLKEFLSSLAMPDFESFR